MNTRQLNVNPDLGEVEEDTRNTNVLTHTYNLRWRPTKKSAIQHDAYWTTINYCQATPTCNSKPSGHKRRHKKILRKLKWHTTKGAKSATWKKCATAQKKEDMTYDERKKGLRYLMFLKEKRDGTIKARRCANGRSQCEYTTMADTSWPTVSLKAMMMSCAINEMEGRHVAVTDIPGAFLHADMEEDIHMLLEGTIAKLILKLDPSL